MNEYGFLNAKSTVFIGDSSKAGEKLLTSDIDFLKNVNPLLANNQSTLDEAVLDPDKFDTSMKYAITPIPHERKVLLDSGIPINQIDSLSVSDVLYRTREMAKFIDPGSTGYDQWVQENSFRQVAIKQIDHISTPEEMNQVVHSMPFDFTQLSNEECSLESGIFINPQDPEDVVLAQDVCMEPEKYTHIANQEMIDRIREEESKELSNEPSFAPKPKRTRENNMSLSPF